MEFEEMDGEVKGFRARMQEDIRKRKAVADASHKAFNSFIDGLLALDPTSIDLQFVKAHSDLTESLHKISDYSADHPEDKEYTKKATLFARQLNALVEQFLTDSIRGDNSDEKSS